MNFEAKRCFLSAQQQLNFTPEKIFPLLCPTREYDWIEHWKCDLVYSESGLAEPDCIFVTEFPDDEKDVWVVDRYEPNHLIQFIRVSENRAIRYRITLTRQSNKQTTALWEQTITALTEAGNQLVGRASSAEFNQKIKGLEHRINHYLETGEMLRA